MGAVVLGERHKQKVDVRKYARDGRSWRRAGSRSSQRPRARRPQCGRRDNRTLELRVAEDQRASAATRFRLAVASAARRGENPNALESRWPWRQLAPGPS
eukprot:6175799-Pleurochrysis_carterae.AAC.1